MPPAPAEWGLGSGVPVKLGALTSVDSEVKGTGDDVCLLTGGSSCCLGDGGFPKDSCSDVRL